MKRTLGQADVREGDLPAALAGEVLLPSCWGQGSRKAPQDMVVFPVPPGQWPSPAHAHTLHVQPRCPVGDQPLPQAASADQEVAAMSLEGH